MNCYSRVAAVSLCLMAVRWLAPLSAAEPKQAEQEPQRMMLFNSGDDGYPRYRVPSTIVAPNGDVLTFCEGRKGGGGFTGDIDIVMKRSTDGGKTWGPLRTIADDGPNTLGYPVPVIERQTKTLWLAFTRGRGSDTEKQIVESASQERPVAFVMSSTDSGATWSKPIDISATTKRPEWTWYGVGAGIGVQLQSGRLVFPAYHNVEKTKDFSSHMIYSDDLGRSWKLGSDVGGMSGECQVAERRDGTLYINARNQQGANWVTSPAGRVPTPQNKQLNERIIANSSDGGQTWSKPTTDPALFDPICQGMIYVWPNDKPNDPPLWIFSNPAGPNRRNLTFRVSRDEGRTWPIARRVQEGASEYSCLTKLPDGQIGCIYERWENNNIRIYWSRVSLAWLLAGEPPGTP